jgi:hypothetical protein
VGARDGNVWVGDPDVDGVGGYFGECE